MTSYETVIGLEVHVQLATRTKLFCACRCVSPGAGPNSAVCPVCTGQPGALPVLNARALELAARAALALGCRLRPHSVFARKNYFYPDLPKGYQISQYEEPLAEEGALELSGGRVRVRRVHIEEDAGKLLHDVGARALEYSLLDCNRAGVPLIEIVTEPDLRSPEAAFDALTRLKALLQYAGVSRCDMEKGELRCDANVSLRPAGSSALGTKVELKNLNSFRMVRDALAYEAARQSEILRGGGRVAAETRLWEPQGGVSRAMRSKEEEQDYRYFPDPDLPPVAVDEAFRARLRAELPEPPEARRARLRAQYGLSDYDAGVLTAEKAAADYFEAAAKGRGLPLAKGVANWMQTELFARLNAAGLPFEESPVAPERLGELAELVAKGTLSGKLGKEIFAKMWETQEAPDVLVERLGLAQVSDEAALADWVAQALAENPQAVEDVRAGKERALGALVGAVMKKSGGKANPGLAQRMLKEKLS